MQFLIKGEKRKVTVGSKTSLQDQEAVLLSVRQTIVQLRNEATFLMVGKSVTRMIGIINIQGYLDQCQEIALEIVDKLPGESSREIQDLIIRVQSIQGDLQKIEEADTK